MVTHLDVLPKRAIGDDIVRLCTSSDSVSSQVATAPSVSPGEAWQTLYGDYEPSTELASQPASDADLERAAKCGKWGATPPSELFLRIYHDVLAVVEESPDRAMVSPSLLGSSGVARLTVISTIPDIVRHMANVIAHADKEVFFATNFWQSGVASRYITNAIRELNRRAGQRGARVVVKVMYDRAGAKQVVDPHHIVSENEFAGKGVGLPAPQDIPNISIEVMNYHQPIFGTFHAKYMVVDRKIAILQSNNIMDNDNLEMMVHLEGPIVDSFYDMALMSWDRKMEPPLPTRNTPAASASYEGTSYSVSEQNATKALASEQATSESSTSEPATSENGRQGSSSASSAKEETTAATVVPSSTVDSVQQRRSELRPNAPNGPDPATQSFLDSGKNRIPDWCVKQPLASDGEIPLSTSEHPRYDKTILKEILRVQSALSPRDGETKMEAVTRLLNHSTNHISGDAPDFAEGDEMAPYVPHEGQKPFPIAMVNRPPYGSPNHSAVVQPQNVAWLSALRHAKKNVFIQSPTLNAEPLLPAIREACERGIDVICYICLGYNDTGELLPKQGGTNEMIANQLYTSLSEEARNHLHYFWYVGKDQTRPIPQVKKSRDCHIKLMIVDESIGIMGNGNQDTQSWFHSQEINVMLESQDVCQSWIEGLRRNQNTHIYGMLEKTDGIWRDYEGAQAAGAMGIDPGHFSWLKGVIGAVQRVRGIGGF